MVSVRRVKFLLALALIFVVFIGLYQLEKRRQTSLNIWPSSSNSRVRISWHNKIPVAFSSFLSINTTKVTTVNKMAGSKTNSARHAPALKIWANEIPQEEEEESIANEIDDTLEWVQRMGQDKRHNDGRNALADVRESTVDRDSNQANADASLRDSNDNQSVYEVSPTEKVERDSNQANADAVLRESNDNQSVYEVSPTEKVERDSNQANADAVLRESNDNQSVYKVSPTEKVERDSNQANKTTVRPKGSDKVDFSTENTKYPFTTATEQTQSTTNASTNTFKVQPNTEKDDKTTVTLPSSSVVTSYGSSPTPLRRVNTCNLPKLDPWDSSIRHLLKDVGSDPDCISRYPRSLYGIRGNRLHRRDNSSDLQLKDFSLETIHRTKDSDNDFYIKNVASTMSESFEEVYKTKKILESDFLRISYQTGERKESHYFARVVPRHDVINNSKKLRQNGSFSKENIPLNVLILGMDSTSSANFLRKMPHTLNFLRTLVRSYFMKGYSIVGDATTPALTALLTGHHEYDLPEGRRGFEGSEPIDRWPWISKLYESHGYVTLYGEDDPTMSTFNLRLNGFVEPPYHHFMRPFWLAIESEGLRDEPGICSREMSLVNYTMEYLLSFFEAYKETPKFAMGFLSYLTHAHPNHLSYGDYDVLNLLTEMKSRGYLNNTLLFTLGDHGSRNDDVRSTMQGKLEERLPWLSITVPDWLESQHPELTAALANNKNIISSPFDLHATLRHILTYPNMPDIKTTYRSLMTNMSRDRTCLDAGIDEHWCPCLEFEPMDVKNKDIQRAALAVVNHINKRLDTSETLRMSCHKINVTAVRNAMQYQPNEKVQTFYSTNQDTDRKVSYGARTRDDRHYLVTIETSPMSALFEATVTMADDKSILVNPNISRINVYGSQPKCIAEKYPYLKKYCVCKVR